MRCVLVLRCTIFDRWKYFWGEERDVVPMGGGGRGSSIEALMAQCLLAFKLTRVDAL